MISGLSPQTKNESRTPAEFDLRVVKNFFATETCGELVQEMRRSRSSAALTYGKGESVVDDRFRRANRVWPAASTVDYVVRRLEAELRGLATHFGIELSGLEEPQFLRYRVGDFFVAHQDGNTGLVNLESDRTRRVSVTIFLNGQREGKDSDTYGGGSLVFSDWRTGARHEVRGETGMLVAFRSETTHEVLPVTRGERWAIVSWYRR